VQPERSLRYAVRPVEEAVCTRRLTAVLQRLHKQRESYHSLPWRQSIYFGCGLPEGGFARVRCDVCGNEYLVAFSCKQRGFCPSCCAKRAALWVEFVREQVIRPVPHPHLVFALPKVLRPAFRDPTVPGLRPAGNRGHASSAASARKAKKEISCWEGGENQVDTFNRFFIK